VGKFVEQLRNIKIKSPHTRGWNSDSWQIEFLKLPEPDVADRIVFSAGTVFGQVLAAYWSEVNSLGLASFNRTDLLAKITLFLNLLATQRKSPAYEDPSGFSGDHLLTSCGDTLNRALQYLSTIPNDGRQAIPDQTLMRCLSLLNAIYVYEFLWDRVMWSGWELTKTDSGFKLAPATEESAKILEHEAVGEFLRQAEAAQLQMQYADEWEKGKHRDIAPPVIKLVRYKVPRAAFRIERRPVDSMPAYLPQLLNSLPGWLEPMLAKPIAQLGGYGLIEVANAWRLIYEFVRLVQATEEVGLIHIDDAVGLVAGIRSSISRANVRQIVEFLVSDPAKPKGDGIWGAPFVQIEKGVLCPVVPALMHPNIQRMSDLWAERCAKEEMLVYRGALWERHLRESLAHLLQEAASIEDWWLHEGDLNRWGHQIDLLLRVGRLIIVGETKFAKYPCIPAEFGRFFEKTLPLAAAQADLRRNSIERHRSEIARLSRYMGADTDLVILPLVVSPYFLGSGLKFRGVHCVSYDDLLHFLVSDRLPLGPISIKGMNTVASLRYRKEGEEAGDAFLRYLHHPPQTLLYSHAVRRVERKFVDENLPGNSITWIEGIVTLPEDELGFEAFAKRAETLWETEILNGTASAA
jgi:hypothetical protein